jgi:hypothetical protein
MQILFAKKFCGLLLRCLLLVAITSTFTGAAFIRNPVYNGKWQNYGSGWYYCYYTKGDYALWKDGTSLRLRYDYTGRQWWDYGTIAGLEKLDNGLSGKAALE